MNPKLPNIQWWAAVIACAAALYAARAHAEVIPVAPHTYIVDGIYTDSDIEDLAGAFAGAAKGLGGDAIFAMVCSSLEETGQASGLTGRTSELSTREGAGLLLDWLANQLQRGRTCALKFRSVSEA